MCEGEGACVRVCEGVCVRVCVCECVCVCVCVNGKKAIHTEITSWLAL